MLEQHIGKDKTGFSRTLTWGQMNGITGLIGPIQIEYGSIMIHQGNAQPGTSSVSDKFLFFSPNVHEEVCL